jgi:hypothetical protein
MFGFFLIIKKIIQFFSLIQKGGMNRKHLISQLSPSPQLYKNILSINLFFVYLLFVQVFNAPIL